MHFFVQFLFFSPPFFKKMLQRKNILTPGISTFTYQKNNYSSLKYKFYGGGGEGGGENKCQFNLRHQSSFVVLLFLYQICFCFYQVKENKTQVIILKKLLENA